GVRVLNVSQKGACMRSVLARRCVFALAFAVLLLAFLAAAPQMRAQGGEPQYFAIRGAKVVPVSGPPVENATIVMARGGLTLAGDKYALLPAHRDISAK